MSSLRERDPAEVLSPGRDLLSPGGAYELPCGLKYTVRLQSHGCREEKTKGPRP